MAHDEHMDTFSLFATALLALIAGILIGYLLAHQRRGAQGEADLAAANATSRALAPVALSLDKFDARLRDLEASRIEWHAQLREQVADVRQSNLSLRQETATLAAALRRPHVRGQWGEMHLKRTVELAGMIDRCDFDTQVSTRTADGLIRPDMVVHLAGGTSVVVDAKVPLDAYLDVVESQDPEEISAHQLRHVRQVRTHIDQLSAKSYWAQFDATPEFVVLFLPNESFLSAALETDQTLLEHAARKKVVLATPTTLIALLRTVSYGWTQQQLADNAREIQYTARELYERIGTVAGHFDKLGAHLGRAVGSYNEAVASVESRLIVSARRLSTLGASDETLKSPRTVEATPRKFPETASSEQ